MAFVNNMEQSVELAEKVSKKYGFTIAMPNKVYDILSALATIYLPALNMFYVGLDQIWGFGFSDQVDATFVLTVTVLNVVLGLVRGKAKKDYSQKN